MTLVRFEDFVEKKQRSLFEKAKNRQLVKAGSKKPEWKLSAISTYRTYRSYVNRNKRRSMARKHLEECKKEASIHVCNDVYNDPPEYRMIVFEHPEQFTCEEIFLKIQKLDVNLSKTIILNGCGVISFKEYFSEITPEPRLF